MEAQVLVALGLFFGLILASSYNNKRVFMFTGIVQALVQVKDVVHSRDLSKLRLDMGGLGKGVALGASVAINGTCLTVTACDGGDLDFDVIKATLNQTNLGNLKTHDRVNVERSLKVGDEIGGHVVSGHVSGLGQLLARKVDGHDHVLRFALGEDWQSYVFDKGFVAVDGASLTVSSIDRDQNWFEISLIPETIARTTLGHLEVGASANIEVEAQTVTTVDTVTRLLQDADWIREKIRPLVD
jgi:riboflavin synthase